MSELLLNGCGLFYSLLCVFSVVTGIMYASGKKALNPLELSDAFMSKYQDPEKLKRFTIRMGWVTFVVGIVQGITAFSLDNHAKSTEAFMLVVRAKSPKSFPTAVSVLTS